MLSCLVFFPASWFKPLTVVSIRNLKGSGLSISRYMKSQKLQLSVPSVTAFLETLERSYLLYRSPSYDLNSKQLLDISAKYYFEDTGIRNFLCGGLTVADRAKVLEQVVGVHHTYRTNDQRQRNRFYRPERT